MLTREEAKRTKVSWRETSTRSEILRLGEEKKRDRDYQNGEVQKRSPVDLKLRSLRRELFGWCLCPWRKSPMGLA